MVQRLTQRLHLDRNIRFFVFYGACVEDSFVTNALTEISFVSLLDEYLNDHGFQNNIVYTAEKSIRFLRRSKEDKPQEATRPQVQVRRIDLRKVPGAGKPPLDHPVITANDPGDRPSFQIDPDDGNRYVSWPNCVDYFNSVMMQHTQKRAIIFMDAQNCQFDQRFLSCFTKWQIFSQNGSVCLFVYPGEESPRTLGFLESENQATLNYNDQLIKIAPPCADEVRNLLLRLRLFHNLNLDWSILDNFCRMFAVVARSNLISVKRMQSEEVLGKSSRLDQELVMGWKTSRSWMRNVGLKTISNLNNTYNELDFEELKKVLSVVRCQQDSTDVIAERLNLWWYRTKDKPFSFVLAGTSGTGKTFTMETLSGFLEGYGYQYFYVDLTKYRSDAEMNILIGSPPGYVGSETRPELFTKLLETDGKLVICFDELDKAYSRIMDRLMALLDKGELSWNNERGDFRQCVIGFTTNQRMDELVELKKKTKGKYTDQQLSAVLHDIPQFSSYNLGRLGSFHIYNQLDPQSIIDISILEIRDFVFSYKPEVRVVSIDPDLLLEVMIVANGSNKGARVITTAVESKLSTAIRDLLELQPGDSIKLIQRNGSYGFDKIDNGEKDRINKDKALAQVRFSDHERRLDFLDEAHMASCFDHIKSQDDNIARIKGALKSWYSIKNKITPLSLLFVGPSGTGKTESAKAIHKVLEPYGYGYYCIDCNTMQNPIDYYSIIGDPLRPSGQNPRIVEELLQADNRLVICFDEVEKAYSGFFDGIMTLLQEGTLAGGNFRNCVIILTSNLAQNEIMLKKQTALKQNRQIEEKEINEILIRCDPRQQMKETHLGRINHKLVYNVLSSDVIFDIALGMIQEEALNRNISRVRYISPGIMLKIVLSTENSITGARAIRSYIQQQINPLFLSFLQANPDVSEVVLEEIDASEKGGSPTWQLREADPELEYAQFDQVRLETNDLYVKHKRKTNFIDTGELIKCLSPVVCQDDNIAQIIEYLRLEIPKCRERPMSMLFAGMTGTGKTFTADLIAKYMERHGYGYHYETMTNYKSEHDASRFVGSAEGFVGSDSPPAIISKQIQYGGKLVIVLDEFDKAHPSAQDMIMQLLDKGVIQSNKLSADFRQSLVILTSNAADRELVEYKSGQVKQGVNITEPRFTTGVREILRIHKMTDTLLARLGPILVYNRLSAKELTGICWNEAVNALKAYNPDIRLRHIDPKFLFKIVSSQESVNYGARPIRDKVNGLVSTAYASSYDSLQDILDLSLIYDEDRLEIKQFTQHQEKEACLEEAARLVEEHIKKVQFADPEELKQVFTPVVCQEDNIEEIISYLRLELAKKTRVKPMSMLFAGMTGTGKTFTADLIAKYMERHGYGYHYETMTNYKSEHDASRFVGSAEGFVGSDSPPAIISKQIQYGGKLVIVLDEFDKAHPSAQDMIMQLLDKGVIQSNKLSADFRQSLVILTSNAADRELVEYKAGQVRQGISITEPRFNTGIKEILRTNRMADTLLARLDRILVFNPLAASELCVICWNESAKAMKEYNEDLQLCHVDPKIMAEVLCSEGALNYGARPIRDKVKNMISLAYARAMERLGVTTKLALVSIEGRPELKGYEQEPDRETCLKEAENTVLAYHKKVDFADPEELKQALASVVCQDDNIAQIISYLRLETARKTRSRPVSMLFTGMTGTGKTYTADLIAKYMERFGYGYHYETMTNYKSEHDASRFVGAAEGLVGSDSPPAIIRNQIKYQGKLVILLDEFDKAHPTAQDMIMQLLDKGVIQSNKITANFVKSIVILTSNAADRQLTRFKLEAQKHNIPITDPSFQAGIRTILNQAGLQDTFLGRLGKILVFNPLQIDHLLKVCWQEIEKYLRGFEDQHRLAHVDPAILADLVSSSSATELGAREIRNQVEGRIGPVYENCHQEIAGEKELSLITEGDRMVLRNYKGEPAIEECLAGGSGLLAQKVEPPPRAQSVQSEKLDYQHLLTKGCTDASNDRIEDIVTCSVGLVEAVAGSGSGFVVTNDGLFITCYHVLNGCQEVKVRFEHNLGLAIMGRVIAADAECDLALLKLEGDGFHPGPVEGFGEAIDRRNEEVLVAGFPLPDELKISKVNFTKGNVSNMVTSSVGGTGTLYYHLNCNAYPGNSGGPVFSMANKLIIGVLQGGYDSAAQGVNVAISIQAFYNKFFKNTILNERQEQTCPEEVNQDTK